MHLNSEDARSDFILAAATTLFGGLVARLVVTLPLYPRTGILHEVLGLVWLFALTGLVPYLLVRYRDMGFDGFGLDRERSAMVPGLLVAAPIVVLGILRALGRVSLSSALVGRLAGDAFGDPTVGTSPAAADALFELVIRILTVGVLWLGIVMLFTFLTTRAREGFRRTELPLVEATRTFGMGAVAVAFLLGLLTAIRPEVTITGVALNVGALAVAILAADRLVTKRMTTSRATILAPAILALLLHVIGAFDLLFGLYAGAMAAGAAILLAVLVETRTHAWAAVPVSAAMALYPTCISPLAIGTIPGC